MFSSKYSIAQNQLLEVKELYEQLGFDGANEDSSADLKDDLCHFRGEYLASNGTPSRDLVEWRTPQTQNELLRMARAFLVTECYGLKHWPVMSGPASKGRLAYPKDTDR